MDDKGKDSYGHEGFQHAGPDRNLEKPTRSQGA